MVAQLVGLNRLGPWLLSWLVVVGCSVGLIIGCFDDWSVGWFWLVAQLVGLLIGLLVGFLIA